MVVLKKHSAEPLSWWQSCPYNLPKAVTGLARARLSVGLRGDDSGAPRFQFFGMLRVRLAAPWKGGFFLEQGDWRSTLQTGADCSSDGNLQN